MTPIQELADAVYRDRVLRARSRRLEDKLLSGASLFAEVCDRMDCGIRMQFPEADESQVRMIRGQRLRRLRRLQDYDVWK